MKRLKVLSVALFAGALTIGGMSSFKSEKTAKIPGWTKRSCPEGMGGYICSRISASTCPVTIQAGSNGIEVGIYNCHKR